jgi:hypothetical protein
LLANAVQHRSGHGCCTLNSSHDLSRLKLLVTKSLVNQPSYYPKGWAATEAQQYALRALTIEVLKDGRPINVRPVVEPKT